MGMIPPKEKANELVDKFKAYTDAISLTSDLIDDSQHLRNCKQCALIAVDEILSEIYSNNVLIKSSRRMFWQEVKQEIENF